MSIDQKFIEKKKYNLWQQQFMEKFITSESHIKRVSFQSI